MAEKLTLKDIERIRALKQDGLEYGIRHWDAYENETLKHAPALLDAAERWLTAFDRTKHAGGSDLNTIYDRAAYGEKCREFFREMEEKSKRLCATCHYRDDPPTYQCLADFDCYTARIAREKGLWPMEGE